MAVVGPNLSGALPPTVTFGGPTAHDEQLLVRFPQAWSPLQVDAAFLLLEPAMDAAPTSADVAVEVALAGAEWDPGAVRRAPPRRAPSSRGWARTRPPSVLRVDVTELVRALAEQPKSDRGMIVRAEGEALRGATYLTGSSGGAPRLDVYGHASAGR